ncbi:divalent cation tolerant protein CUTA, isoform CRA_a [Rattus norvegicus]|uniref:Divalent cation tolerant protein CUTA, isoform CRA_a n=1 Tax=Rattus norvegicus TaxID=10116 RepID=A6JJJ8_RAT|nr:divalent cation tolerant protein CUTA, isoform CRA_a [Rattus norvegicus]
MNWGRALGVLLGGGATLLLSFLCMPALLPVASRLLLLPRALLSMASGSPPSQPSPASGSGYVPGSVSAAFVTCPNEKVAKEIARWGNFGPRTYEGKLGIGRGCCLWGTSTTPGRAHSDLASPSGQW